MRATTRFNEEEEAQIKLLMTMTGLEDTSKVIKFAIDYTISSYNFVARSLFPPNYDLYVSRQTKTNKAKKVFYFEK